MVCAGAKPPTLVVDISHGLSQLRNGGVMRMSLTCAALCIATSAAWGQSKLPVQNEYTIYHVRLPNTGFLEVTLEPTHWTTRVMLEFEEFPDLKSVDVAQTKTFTITRPQELNFQLINEPTNGNAFWTTAYTPTAQFSLTQQGWQMDRFDYSMAGGGVVQLRYKYVPLQISPSGRPLVVCQGGQGPYVGPFERGLCSTDHCSQFEGWVRGRADVDPVNGQVAMLMQLETDALDVGPKGVIQVTFKDDQGNALATINSGEIGTGGKAPGRARIENVPASTNIPPALAARVSTIAVHARCTGYVEKWFNLLPGKLEFTYTTHF
jgi:hypothetical protein